MNEKEKKAWTQMWDTRYSEEAYAYGEAPNEYLKAQLKTLSRGKILFAAEGEGRNAVYASRLGWDVHAFDISKEAKKKATSLASKNEVEISYEVGELENLSYELESFDAIALVYAHFPEAIRAQYHQMLQALLKPGGHIILEAFSMKHLDCQKENPQVGGPKDASSLLTREIIMREFTTIEIEELYELEINLQEGLYHNGKSSVLRLSGKKR